MGKVLNTTKLHIRLICSVLFGIIIGIIIALAFNIMKQSNITNLLCKDKNCWYIYEYNDLINKYQLYHNMAYKFYSNKTCKTVQYSLSDDCLYEVVIPDVITSNKWDYNIKSHILHFDDSDAYILSLNCDTMEIMTKLELGGYKPKILINWSDKRPTEVLQYIDNNIIVKPNPFPKLD